VREWTEALYSALDMPALQRRRVQRTTLSTVLHRKLPHFSPLPDAYVNQCHYGENGGIECDSKQSSSLQIRGFQGFSMTCGVRHYKAI